MAGMLLAVFQETKDKGPLVSIDPVKPLRNYWHAMTRPDTQEWAEAYNKDYMGIKQRSVFKTVLMKKWMKLMGMATCMEYEVSNCVFSKHKVRLCTMRTHRKTRKICNTTCAVKVSKRRFSCWLSRSNGCHRCTT